MTEAFLGYTLAIETSGRFVCGRFSANFGLSRDLVTVLVNVQGDSVLQSQVDAYRQLESEYGKLEKLIHSRLPGDSGQIQLSMIDLRCSDSDGTEDESLCVLSYSTEADLYDWYVGLTAEFEVSVIAQRD